MADRVPGIESRIWSCDGDYLAAAHPGSNFTPVPPLPSEVGELSTGHDEFQNSKKVEALDDLGDPGSRLDHHVTAFLLAVGHVD